MRAALLILIGVSALAGGAFAADPAAHNSRVKEAIGNTIVQTYPDGRKAEIWLKADGAYTGEGRRHDISNGTWRVQGEQICFHQLHPSLPFGLGKLCRAIPQVSVGQTWQSKSATGETVTVKLERGRSH